VARQQADQIFNLSLTRTATKTLLAPGARGVIGIGRVKTPTLGIVCLRELEIRNFRPEDYFEIAATAKAAGGAFTMRHAPPLKHRIKDRARAEAIARPPSTIGGRLGCRSSNAVRLRQSFLICRRCKKPVASVGAGLPTKRCPSPRNCTMAMARS